jgi:hypothetical protein
MTQEEFIQILDEKRYSYEIEGDKIVVTHKGYVFFRSLTGLPSGVEFGNEGAISLPSLTSIPSGVEFRNRGSVGLRSLTGLSPGMKFSNEGDVFLESLIGEWFGRWSGNIEGIGSKRLLNKMISIGLFDRG